MPLVAAAAAAVAGLTACSSATATSPALRTIVLDIRFSHFSTTAITARPGEVVRFVVRNHDPIPHELIVGDQSVQDYHEHGTEAHHGGRPGEVSVAAGSTAETTYTLVATGSVLFGCHLPGHWAYGMRGTIQVA